jgi:hypothetical protein
VDEILVTPDERDATMPAAAGATSIALIQQITRTAVHSLKGRGKNLISNLHTCDKVTTAWIAADRAALPIREDVPPVLAVGPSWAVRASQAVRT